MGDIRVIYLNALPVFLDREKLVVTANTRVLLETHYDHITVCSNQFPPAFVGKNSNKLVAEYWSIPIMS